MQQIKQLFIALKSTAVEYFGEAYRAYIYFRNPKGEDVTFYRTSDAAFADYIKTKRSF